MADINSINIATITPCSGNEVISSAVVSFSIGLLNDISTLFSSPSTVWVIDADTFLSAIISTGVLLGKFYFSKKKVSMSLNVLLSQVIIGNTASILS